MADSEVVAGRATSHAQKAPEPAKKVEVKAAPAKVEAKKPEESQIVTITKEQQAQEAKEEAVAKAMEDRFNKEDAKVAAEEAKKPAPLDATQQKEATEQGIKDAVKHAAEQTVKAINEQQAKAEAAAEKEDKIRKAKYEAGVATVEAIQKETAEDYAKLEATRRKDSKERKNMTDEEWVANIPERHLKGYAQTQDDVNYEDEDEELGSGKHGYKSHAKKRIARRKTAKKGKRSQKRKHSIAQISEVESQENENVHVVEVEAAKSEEEI